MRLSIICLFGLLFCGVHLSAKDRPDTSSNSTQSSTAVTSQPVNNELAAPCLQVGLGYPDLRLRYNIWGPLDVEAKVAAGTGEVAYAGRLYWRAYDLGPVGLVLGGEIGGVNYNAVDTLNGNGYYYEPFVGLQYNFIKRWALLVDYGPAWIDVTSQNNSLTEQQWILNTALYYAFF